jgi:hypothetical protein
MKRHIAKSPIIPHRPPTKFLPSTEIRSQLRYAPV